MPAYLDIENSLTLNDSEPIDFLKALSNKVNLDLFSEEFSIELDKQNIWPCHRDRFCYPKLKELPNGNWNFLFKPNKFKFYS